MHPAPDRITLLDELKANLNTLRRSERLVAELVLADPAAATRRSISSLARLAGVSEPTVNRLCRSMNCSGFPDFKLRLAQSLVNEPAPTHLTVGIQPLDTAGDLIDKMFDRSIASLMQARKKLDPAALEQATNILAVARQIQFFGAGASAAVAMDALNKFFRLDIPVAAHTDQITQRLLAAILRSDDAVVLISSTGRTKITLEVAETARQAGATLIGLTAPGSALAALCHCVIGTSPPEDTDLYAPMTSRLVHLVLLDCLASSVALRRGPRIQEPLAKVKKTLRVMRTEK